MDLSGKKILFIGPKYYDYHTNIIQTLEKWDANVDFHPEMVNDFFQRTAKIIKGKFQTYVQQRYLNKILNKIYSKQYNVFFLIRGEIITAEFVQQLRILFPNATFIMYQWDSLKHNNYLSKLPYFDKVLTFDPIDATTYQLDYLPLFYTETYNNIATSNLPKDYDIVFFGAYHSTRLDIVKKIAINAHKYDLKFHHHLFITKFSLIRGFLLGKISLNDLKYLKTFTVPSSTIQDAYKRTKAVLDIEMNQQNGLTIRTLEVLGANLKLITTNTNIVNENFFDSNHIFLLDRKNIELDLSFFTHNPEKDIAMQTYHINNWLTQILSKVTA